MTSNFQAFPQMIYHPVHGQKVIKTEQELQEHIKCGWYNDFQEFQKIDTLSKSIEYHEKELEKLKKEWEKTNNVLGQVSKNSEPSENNSGDSIGENIEIRKKPGRPKRG